MKEILVRFIVNLFLFQIKLGSKKNELLFISTFIVHFKCFALLKKITRHPLYKGRLRRNVEMFGLAAISLLISFKLS